ncbi:urocanate hydratase [Cognatitamlana onchidii]|uniref:urocanate hydratase n=1 Tax=Cognatitamlana onchidii TaxID=2562860 RepID=UPI0010A68C35|nr:urocanate hydratase [Algibacter onchidii]
MTFKEEILQGIPNILPAKRKISESINRAPKRKDILSKAEKLLALKNALRYFPNQWHQELASEFLNELKTYGRIYMYRFKPTYKLKARPLKAYPSKSIQTAAIMLMIQNNLDPEVAQHPEELITYGGNGSVFQNWAQYLLTMQYLATMTNQQTLHIYSGHPLGLFPSSKQAPRVVVSNGMMIPNYSKPDHWEKFNALGVTQYGQMTAGSFMYIGPQGIVHGTTITIMNAFRKILKPQESPAGKIFLTAGLGGMSGAQPKAGNIVGCITIVAEVNPLAAEKRYKQGWVDKLIYSMAELVLFTKSAQASKKSLSIAFIGNVVDVWEQFLEARIFIHLGSDQTSLHIPWTGGYYPVGLSFEASNHLLKENPEKFKLKVKESLVRHAAAINKHCAKGTYFFDYGNAFLLEASRAGAHVLTKNNIDFKYPSYVQDILGPMCFDYGFGPFRWVCSSGLQKDLDETDKIAENALKQLSEDAPKEIQLQLQDNITWIQNAKSNNMIVGSKARILYADALGRIKIAQAFNDAIKKGIIGPVILGRDHHDVSGTDSPYRETSNIYDGSKYTADMAIHNVIGDSFRGATWVSIHNGGGVGWGEVINGGFGLVLDGSLDSENQLKNMLFYDVNNGIARRGWARNKEALFAIKREMSRTPSLKVTLPNLVEETIINNIKL